MQARLRSIWSGCVASVGLAALTSAAFAANGDAGTSTDWPLDAGGGSLAFVLNAGFAVCFIIAAKLITRRASRQSDLGSATPVRSNTTLRVNCNATAVHFSPRNPI
jgi:hypothetical protein